jgi:chaperonin GroES
MSTELKTKIKPSGDRVLVQAVNREETTESGIILPETLTPEKPEEGIVLAVGPGERNEKGERIALDVEVGQKIMFTKYGPNEIELDGEKYLIIKEKDILAIFE